MWWASPPPPAPPWPPRHRRCLPTPPGAPPHLPLWVRRRCLICEQFLYCCRYCQITIISISYFFYFKYCPADSQYFHNILIVQYLKISSIFQYLQMSSGRCDPSPVPSPLASPSSPDVSPVENLFEIGLWKYSHFHKAALQVRYDPVSRNPTLKYSGGDLHGPGEVPLSFDHNFDRWSSPELCRWL